MEHVAAPLLGRKTLLKILAAEAAGTGITGFPVLVATFLWVLGTPAFVGHPLLHACRKSSHGAAGALCSSSG